MILRLLFIFSLPFLGSSFKYSIEKGRCEIETACYIRKSCFDSSTEDADKNELVRYKVETLKEDSCDVFLQIRPFNSLEFQFMVKVNSSIQPISAEGVAFKQGLEEQFRCKDGIETTGNTKFTISSYGERHPFDEHLLSCSIILKSTTEKIAIMFDDYKGMNPEIVFTAGGQSQSIKYGASKSDFWLDAIRPLSCDPNIIHILGPSNDTHVFEEVDPTRNEISCSALQFLQIERGDLSSAYPKFLKCNGEDWSFEKISDGQSEIVLITTHNNVQEIVKAACVSDKCSLCEPIEHFACGHGCIRAEYNNTPGRCAETTCPNNLWRLSADEKKVEGKMECRHNKMSTDPRESVWYITTQSEEKYVPTASCAKDANCENELDFGQNCPLTDRLCGIVSGNNGDKRISCIDFNHKLSWKVTDGPLVEVGNLTCSIVTGKYSDENGKVVPTRAGVFCIPDAKSTTDADATPAAASAFSKETLIGMGVGGILLLVLCIVASIFFAYHRRKKRYAAAATLKRQLEQSAKRRAEAAVLVKNPNPDYDVTRKNVPESEKTLWEKRKLFRENQDISFELLNNWNDEKFNTMILLRFLEFSIDSRLAVLQNLFALTAYDIREQDEEAEVKSVSNIRQFFALWKHCSRGMMDCITTWEAMWRFMKILYENYIPHDDSKETGKKMVKLVVDWARGMLNELTWKVRSDENECDAHLRCLAVRMLLWAEAPDVILELTRLADLPVDQLQVPMRAVVLAFAARNLGRAEEMKIKLWEDVENNAPDGLQFGTLRAHILYGLCAARDESKKDTPDEFKVLKEVMAAIFSYAKVNLESRSFVPLEQLWAFRGAAEHVSNWKPAVECFVTLAPLDPIMTIEKVMQWRCNQSKVAMELMRVVWKPHIVAMFNLVCEMCTMKKQFDEAASSANILNEYVYIPSDIPILLKTFNLIKLGERASNLNNLISDPKVATIFYEAIEDIKHRADPYNMKKK